jgi:hypothetical protein
MKNVWLNYLISIQIIGMLFLTVSLEDRQADKYDQLTEVIEAAKTDRKIGAASPAVTLLKMFKD